MDEIKTKNVWTVLCERAITDKDNNLLTMIEALENLNVNYSPKNDSSKTRNNDNDYIKVFHKFAICSYWEMETKYRNKDLLLEISFLSPKNKKLGFFSIPFKTEKETQRFVINMDELVVSTSGRYLFSLTMKYKDKEISKTTLPLRVTVRKKE